MAFIMTAQQFIAKAKEIQKSNTVYMYGTYGQALTTSLITSKGNQYPNNNTLARQAKHKLLIGKGYTAWDCVGLIKGILWGWDKITGVKYRGNTLVPDTGANGMINLCTGISDNFKNIVPGEAVWLSGHIGIYLGDGLVAEATTKWTDNVLISYLANIGKVSGYNGRTWTKHGKLPWVDYSAVVVPEPPIVIDPDVDYILHKVVKGDNPWKIAIKYYGNGSRYTEIMDFNKLKRDATIYTWQTLKIPMKGATIPTPKPEPEVPVTPPAEEQYIIHVVVKGETPWGIAERYLGDGRKYKAIMQASGLANDAMIYPKQQLKVPVGKHIKHVVVKGNTPWGLAKTYLGNGNRYYEIMELNGLKPTTHIKVGQVLLIPFK